jgi:hypothetical protein
MQGVMGYGQCKLTTNPQILLLFSDRTISMSGVNQPFSAKKFDTHVVSLDLVNNTITNKSITWNFEKVFTSVTRSGDVIYASSGANMIILSLHKVRYPPNVPISCTDW